MSTLRLRNCTNYPVRYYRDVAFHKNNYVAPGEEGTYHWGATYTLCAKRADADVPGSCRDAVDQGGIYYAYWEGERLHIFDEKQIAAFDANEDNPHAYDWRGKLEHVTLKPEWHSTGLLDNSEGGSSQKFEVTLHSSLVKDWRDRRILTVKKTNEVKWTPGGKFAIEGLGSLEAHPGDVTIKTETEDTRLHEEGGTKLEEWTQKKTFEIAPGHAVAQWQAVVDMAGNLESLPYFAFTERADEAPRAALPVLEADVRRF